jgi:hypothetical protein
MEKTVLTLNTLARGETNMQQGDYFAKNPNIVKLFDDLEEFKDFCRYSFAYGYEGLVFNEKDLYDGRSRAWTLYLTFKKYGPRKWKPRFNKPWKKGKNFRKSR